MNFIMHPASANRSAELADIQQLSRLAHGLLRIDGYCAEQFAAAGPGSDPQGGAEAPGPGNQPGHSRDAGVSEPFGGF
jgi:hypothetical protein